jgi:hypothetical protein
VSKSAVAEPEDDKKPTSSESYSNTHTILIFDVTDSALTSMTVCGRGGALFSALTEVD